MPQLPQPLPAPPSQEEALGFDPQSIYYSSPPQVKILNVIDLPAWAVTQWHAPLASRYSLGGIVEAHRKSKPGCHTDIFVSLGFTILIFVQWLLIGAFSAPGFKEVLATITICGVVAALALPVPFVGGIVAGAAIRIAALMWLMWLGVLLARSAMAGWKLLNTRFI